MVIRIYLLQNVHITDCSDPMFLFRISFLVTRVLNYNITNNFTVCAFPVGVCFSICCRNHRLHIRVAKKSKFSVPFLSSFLILVSWGGMRLSPFGTSANVWPAVPARDDR
jgi:hypothetical protein